MTPRQVWRDAGPVEAAQLHRHTQAAVKAWLAKHGYGLEIHEDDGDHGLVSHAGGLIHVRYGDWVTLAADGKRPQVWDAAEYAAVHTEVAE